MDFVRSYFGTNQSCSVSKETTDVTATRGMLWSDSVIILALLNEFVYKYRGNNTYVIQDKTALIQNHTVQNSFLN